jgi:cytochrome oxidase assembly protein ShyY1
VFSLVRQPRWLALIAVTAVLCVAFWWLGLWQWHRHQDRAERNEAVHAVQDLPATPLDEVMPDPTQLPTSAVYRQTTAVGTYLADEQALQRNPGGRAGFMVITPLELDSGGSLLVNRGFVTPSTTDPYTPATDVVPPGGKVEVIVRLRAPSRTTDRSAPEGQIYDIDPAAYPFELPAPVYATYGDLVQQSPAASDGLELPATPDIGMGPHLYYAWQWWSFIPIAVIGLILLMRRELQDAEGRGVLGDTAGDTPDGALPDDSDRAPSRS